MALCKPNSICTCAIPCKRCKCVIEADKFGNIIYYKDRTKIHLCGSDYNK